jgi:hypothetical protein
LEKEGPNSMPDTEVNPLRRALTKFWSPIPWMLEAAILLELMLGKYVEAGIIGVLLTFNAVLGFFQEGRAQATLTAMKSRLAMTASACRDGVWKNLPAAELVTGDLVKLSLGGVVAADVKLTAGNVLPASPSGRKPAPVSRRMLERSCGAAKPSRRLLRRESAPSLDTPPSWCAQLMSSVHSKRPFCMSCVISRCSTAF